MNRESIRRYLNDPHRPSLRFFPHRVAEELSDLAAVLLYDLQARIKGQKKPLVRDRLVWTFDSLRVFAERHPYASEPGIRKAFLALEAAGLIQIEKTGSFNRKRYDRKWWYHVTGEGIATACIRRIRFNPEIGAALGIPKAVLLEAFRHQLYKDGAGATVVVNPAELRIPYSSKTIERHLNQLVEARILERLAGGRSQYRLPMVAEKDWRGQKEPITVPAGALLPVLAPGQVGLLVGHSGTGKTSVASFVAVQSAIAGEKVLYITLEEPLANIINRTYAQEAGVPYTDLHRHEPTAQRAVQDWTRTASERKAVLTRNLKFADLSGRHSQTHEVLDAIHLVRASSFSPTIIIIDQLEFLSVEFEEAEQAATKFLEKEERLHAATMGKALAAALAIKECLPNQECSIWVLHQVMGACENHFKASDVAGGTDLVDLFDCTIGIGRATSESKELRLFSLSPAIKFEQMLDADFHHMRFRPRKPPLDWTKVMRVPRRELDKSNPL